MDNWLSEEEQYKEVLNNAEIPRIKDPVLREIRQRHWDYRHEIYRSESTICDEQLSELTDMDAESEQIEIQEYRETLK